MNTERTYFLEKIIKEISGLNYVFLNYFFDSPEQIPSDLPVEILIDKEDYTTLLYVISSSRRITLLRTKYGMASQIVEIHFADFSSVVLKIKAALTGNGNVLMNTEDVLKTSATLMSSVKVPSPGYQFEYSLLNSTLNKVNVPEYQQKYFAKMNFDERSQIFAHITSKYKFVIHLLDDLYLFQKRNYRKINSAVSKDKVNSGLRFLIHKVQFAFKFLYTLLFASWQEINLKEQTAKENIIKAELKSLLHRNAVVKISQ